MEEFIQNFFKQNLTITLKMIVKFFHERTSLYVEFNPYVGGDTKVYLRLVFDVSIVNLP